MKPTEKQIIALQNLAAYLGDKPPKVKTVEDASVEIKKLIKRVQEYDSEMNSRMYEMPSLLDFAY